MVIPLHQILYGYAPPRISESIMGNLKEIVDWLIEEGFSYASVFKCLIPPHALLRFLLGRLMCREVDYQIIIGGINTELKASQKKFWPLFPVHIGKCSLINFGHSKVEAVALEDIKLVDLELTKHDPYQIVGNNIIHCNMNMYEHEASPCDDMFKGARTYEEILYRVHALSPNLQTNFLTFQNHRRSGFSKILQVESTTPPPTQGSIPPGFGSKAHDKETAEENIKNNEASSQKAEASQSKNLGYETSSKSKTPPNLSQMIPPSSLTIHFDIPKTTRETQYLELGIPIASLTPIQSTFGTPHLQVIYASDLTPISREEIPPSDYFFSKKRKEI
jgi:hypothetical protein